MVKDDIDFSAITNSRLFKEYSSPQESLELNTKGYNSVRVTNKVMKSLFKTVSDPSNYTKEFDEVFRQFAFDNNFTFTSLDKLSFTSKDTLPSDNLVCPNAGLKIGALKKLEGIHKKLPFTYYSGIYSYKKFFGVKKPNGPKFITALQVDLPKHIPQLYVGLRQNQDFYKNEVFANPNNFEERTLEGSFSNVYAVYAERSDRLTAQYILSPDVMQLLLRNKMFNLWIDGTHLVIIINMGTLQIYIENILDYFNFMDLLINNIDALKNL